MATRLREPPLPEYEADAVGWAEAQAAALRARRVELLDWENLAEEIEGVARNERDHLESALRLVTMHLLKWENQSGRRSRSWWTTIANQRDRARKRLHENPSLRPRLSEIIEDAYRRARRDAADEMDMSAKLLPTECPYSFDEIMTRPIEWDGELA